MSYLQIPHDAMPNCCFLWLFIEVVANANNLCLEVLCPVAILHVVVIVLGIFGPKAVENSKRVFHVVVEVSANKVIEGFDTIVEDANIVDRSKK